MKYRIALLMAVWVSGGAWAAPPATTQTPAQPPGDLPDHVVKVLRTTNKAQTNRYVPKVYEFKNVNPFDVVRFYRRVMEIEEGRFATFVAPDGKSGLVLVVAPEYQLASLDNLMATLDRPGLTSSGDAVRKYIQLKHRAADDVGLLWTIWGNAVHTASAPPGGTRAYNIVFICDVETNAIFVRSADSRVRQIIASMGSLDVPVPQVLVEAAIYEIDLNHDGAIGLDYVAWKNGPGRNLFAAGGFAEYERVDHFKGGANLYDSGVNTFGLPEHRFSNRGANAAYFLDLPSAYFDFLIAKGVARVVTRGQILSKMPTTYKSGLDAFGQADFDPDLDRPSLTGSPAEFRANDEVLYWSVVTNSTARAGARSPGRVLDPYGDDVTYPDNRVVLGKAAPLRAGGTKINDRAIAAVDVGTLLQVTPRIATENLSLGLRLEVSSLLGFDGAGAPRLSARRAATDVRVRDGEEVVFGGMERTVRSQSSHKIPMLGSIPVLGWVFGGETSTVKKTVVVTVIRAARVPDGLPGAVEQIIRQVAGSETTPLPRDRFGFDQWGLDDEGL
jgi:type II secretory pathway component GspD/PulD (secretin)